MNERKTQMIVKFRSIDGRTFTGTPLEVARFFGAAIKCKGRYLRAEAAALLAACPIGGSVTIDTGYHPRQGWYPIELTRDEVAT
jgi:hypothetical protein